ncbi:MAG: GntR family transcriptional regulator [Tissierellia bacterium]|nr:GntR family transcriptional regulator [Tissierellia bacterium]MDD3226649.1 GntR family transcriptional regulator [Tissierellia bacterium]MDD3750997.1 GntR family transcriptional regulator [Tissierellia bacterium]MDD4046312.1 GntR family transcriptional regulator [Tissierellia bacterium]MDD4677765.1 GntR family transcriptional regulator [Tissierellia bacterium]
MIRIDNDNPKAIYEQIYDEVIRLIFTKSLKPDEKLPSVRELASMIRINPNTIQKAYKYLEENNYIYTVKGIGNFVKDADELRNLHIKNMKDELYKVIKSLKELGLRDDKILEIVEEVMNPSTKGGRDVNDK